MHAALIAVAFATAATTPAPTPASAPSAPPPLAVLPVGALTEGVGSLATIESLVVSSARGLGGAVLAPGEVHAAVVGARRPDLEACEGVSPCLAELGRLLGATTLVTGEVGAIGDGLVVYLGAFDVERGVRAGSTSATLTGDPAARSQAVREAVTRLVAPDRHTGRLVVRAPRAGAQVFVDGRMLGATPLDASLGAGTHALRVTHPQTRDLVRFVDVPFEGTTKVDAQLIDLPVVTDVSKRHGGGDDGRGRRGWWGPVLVGVGAAAVTTAIVLLLAPTTDVDGTIGIPSP